MGESSMSRNLTVMGIIASCFFAGSAFCADWKYYGEFSTVPARKDVLFYDANSIINSNGSGKLWVKIVAHADIEKCLERKSVLEKVSKKMADGYIPPIVKVLPKVTNAADLEGAANEPSVKSQAEILYQISCSENKYRKISGAAADKNGVLNRPFGISAWEEVAPESNADNLAKLLCRSK